MHDPCFIHRRAFKLSIFSFQIVPKRLTLPREEQRVTLVTEEAPVLVEGPQIR